MRENTDPLHGFSREEVEAANREASHSEECHLLGLPVDTSPEKLKEAIIALSNDELNALHGFQGRRVQEETRRAISSRLNM